MDIQYALKNNNNSGFFNYQTLKDALSEGKFLITTEECESIHKFMDCQGTGKFTLRAFMEVFNNERLYAFTQKGLINNSMMFTAVFESLEE